MIGSVIELVAGMGVGSVIEAAAKHVRPQKISKLGKFAYKVGTGLIGVVVTEGCLDYGKKKIKQFKEDDLNIK